MFPSGLWRGFEGLSFSTPALHRSFYRAAQIHIVFLTAQGSDVVFFLGVCMHYYLHPTYMYMYLVFSLLRPGAHYHVRNHVTDAAVY